MGEGLGDDEGEGGEKGVVVVGMGIRGRPPASSGEGMLLMLGQSAGVSSKGDG